MAEAAGWTIVMIPGATRAGIAGIVFDAVGTLIDPCPPVAEAYGQAAHRQGIAIDPSVIKARFVHRFQTDELDAARGPLQTDEATEYQRWSRIVSNVLPEVPDLPRAFAELWDHFGRPDAWRCFPDVPEILRAIRERGLSVAIASNFDARLRCVVAGLDPIAQCAPILVISSEVGYRKPHPAFYQCVSTRMSLPPNRLLWVGDDPENDVRGPQRAGFRTVPLDRHNPPSSGAERISDLTVLKAVLEDLIR